MKKLLAVLVFVLCAGLLMVSSSQSGMSWLTHARYQPNSLLGSDKYLYGDLYGISYLSNFKYIKDVSAVRPDELISKQKDISLYVIGDSYFYSSFEIIPAYFERVNSIQFFKWDHSPEVKFKFSQGSTKRVLLVESVERNVLNLMYKERVAAIFEKPEVIQDKSVFAQINRSIKQILYHPTLEENLSFALFDLALFSKFKELKAELNLSLFGREPAGVKLAKSKDFLYLDQTVDSVADGSSFQVVSEMRLAELVQNMRQIEDYAKKMGFDEVIFSFIPNPVSVLATEDKSYNQFIPRLENKVGSIHFVNPTDELKQQAKQNFFKSDSHWNQRGAKIWLDLLNKQLLSLPK